MCYQATISYLHECHPLAVHSYPNLKSVRELVYKRGYAKVQGQRLPISDNSVIERSLGKHGIMCVEDLIHEIYTVGECVCVCVSVCVCVCACVHACMHVCQCPHLCTIAGDNVGTADGGGEGLPLVLELHERASPE